MVSVVIPAYNEEKTIAGTVSAYREFLSQNVDSFEIIVVNDGSTDNTLARLKDLKQVEVISYNKNRGKGYAVKRGVLRAKGDYVFFTDADGSYAPGNILQGISALENGASGVVGERKERKEGYSFIRYMASTILSGLTKRILLTSIRDTQCGFKGFDKATARQIFSRTQIFDFGFDFEVICLSEIFKKPISSMKVDFEHRKETRVNIFKDSIRIFQDLLRVRHTKEILRGYYE